jgi:transposase
MMKTKGTRQEHFPNSRKRHETTRDERIQIIALRDLAKLSWREIGAAVDVDYRACQKIHARAKINGTPSNARRTGRPPIFNNAEKHRLLEFIIRDKRTRRLGWEDLIQEMGYACSVRTLRDVCSSMGFHKRRARKK